jgi:CxxC motif-containing protein (DUF1111 family)
VKAADDRRSRLLPAILLAVVASGFPACGNDAPGVRVVGEDGLDLPLRAASAEERTEFFAGDAAFGLPFRAPDGLGPLYIRTNCESCHEEGVRGPGTVQKMALVSPDGVTPAPDQSALPYGHTVRPLMTGAATTPLTPPASGWPAGTELKVTIRMPPSVLGRGYLEAIDATEIERLEHEQATRTDGIRGRINRVTYQSEANPDRSFHQYQPGQPGLVGRFGLKARIATLDEFAADAFQGDMGVTSPLRPTELANPQGLVDDGKQGIDVDIDTLNLVARYMRYIEIPTRNPAAATTQARAAFDQAGCGTCHVPSLRTRDDYPISYLAGIDAPVYSDLLLHDMGSEFADGLEDGGALSSEWRTAPLIGLRFQRNYLHDGRAKTVAEAIALHGGPGSQAADSAARFAALPDADRADLIAFVESL